ncbi:MAG: prepilin peptidase [Bacteroidetes bacterium]|nr:prepilin peptidase [Bacteroidota bacterium]
MLSKLALKTCGKTLKFNLSYIALDILWLIFSAVGIYYLSDIERSLITSLLLLLFLIICIADFNYMLIPNAVLYFFTFAGVMIWLFGKTITIQETLIGASVGLLIFWGIGWFGIIVFRKEALGGGDVKLAAVLGLFIGWQGIFPMLFIGSVTALIAYGLVFLSYRKLKYQIPFGPFLALGGIVVYIFGEDFIKIYSDIVLMSS